jgi:hypothetical protein
MRDVVGSPPLKAHGGWAKAAQNGSIKLLDTGPSILQVSE